MPISVRLDAETEGVVRRLSRATGRSRSQVIRDAIKKLARTETNAEDTPTAYAEWADVIGCASGGPRDLSERTGEKFRALLLAGRRT